jgi:hypothetical protein
MEGLSPVYDPETGQANPMANGYRLPTEAEWSAAAGTEPSPARLAAAETKSVERLREPLAKGTAPAAFDPANRLGCTIWWATFGSGARTGSTRRRRTPTLAWAWSGRCAEAVF